MKTIVVKGVGKAKTRPDQVVLNFSLESRHPHYERAMMEASVKIRELTDSIIALGFEKEDVKTLDFRVSTEYESKKDSQGNYYRVFRGYVVRHSLKFHFDFEMEMLSKVLSAVGSLPSPPEMSLGFTVKDPDSVKEELLISAAENARKKAVVLCRASGVTLGALQKIDYNWAELSFYSHTEYDLSDACMEAVEKSAVMDMDIEPEEISSSDTATFVWEIL